MTIVRTFYQSFQELLAPRHCEACGEAHTSPSRSTGLVFLCDTCYASLKAPPREAELQQRLLRHFSQDELSISNFFSLMAVPGTSPMLDLIHSLKYRGMSTIGYELGKELGMSMYHLQFLDFEMIVPIPIHSARKRERGYNQAEEIAKGIAEILHITLGDRIIKRSVYTRTQTEMNARERKENVAGVFVSDINTAIIHNKKLLLVDDVLTTGSTLNSCASSLLELGARQVNIATLAVAE